MIGKNVIAVFVKYPEPGKVKTRLAAGVGAVRAAEIYRLLVASVLRGLPGGQPVCVFFDPPEKGEEIREWLREDIAHLGAVELLPQSPGDLGQRLLAATGEIFAKGADKVAVIGTDCIGLGAEVFSRVWGALDEVSIVFGPVVDGGYYIVGLSEEQPAIFEDIPWSTDQTLSASVTAAHRAGLTVEVLKDMLRDVDTAEDWRQVEAEVVSKFTV